MPIKLKKSVRTFDKKTQKTKVEHFYIKNYSNKELESLFASESTRPKVKVKIENELIKRGSK